jgi:hypothetical protein
MEVPPVKLSIDIGQRRRLGEILVEEQMITADDLSAALATQKLAEGSPRLGKVLLDLKLISPVQFMRALSKQLTTVHRLVSGKD